MEILQIQLLRTVPAWRKMEILGDLNASVRMLAMSGLHLRFPQADEAELRRHLADILLGKDLACKVYGEWKNAA